MKEIFSESNSISLPLSLRHHKPYPRDKWLPTPSKATTLNHPLSIFSSPFKFWMQAHSARMAEPIPQFSHIHFPLARFLNWKWKFSMESQNKKLISMASLKHDTFSRGTKMYIPAPYDVWWLRITRILAGNV